MFLSKAMHFLGCLSIGSPESLKARTGINISPEFYFQAVDRTLPLNYTEQTMRDKFEEDNFRRKLNSKLAVISAVVCIFVGYGVLGQLIPRAAEGTKYAFHKAKSIAAQVGGEDAKKARIKELVKRSEEIVHGSKNGALTPAQEAEYREIEREFNELRGRKQ